MSALAIYLSVGLITLLLLGVPVAFTLAILAITGLYIADINPIIFAQRALAGTNVTSLLAIPGFILAGDLMSSGGLSRRLVRFAAAVFGHLTGGLSMATVVAGTFFGAISGSAPATTAAVGSVMIDELDKRGYKRGYAAALATSVGPIGQMIPPSIPMVIWGVLAEQSIARLFLAGVVPGLIAAAGFMVVSYFYARHYGLTSDKQTTWLELRAAVRDGIWALLAPVVILGGIYGGVFTPTEASMVGVFYGLIVGLFIYKELKWTELGTVLLRSMRTSGIIMFIISMAYAFAYLMANEQIPAQIAGYLLSISDNPLIILLLVNLLLLILGAIMDNVSGMVILSSVLTAIGAQIGMDPIQLGAMVVINLAVGMVTPPVGYSIFVGASISGLRVETVALHLWPFLLVLLGVIALVAYVPAVTLWLPGLMS
ncbi:C4-dicarboxylate transporter DctM subunit [Natronocella acetinitrilica]|uniref:TRAP transporter large permease protein n=1 Tax=Natronocella acetinitrilica TaxID=414046 RepID=A0AAE3G505_9GAMM|nr:TRAP transporter large permease [Natronocella acetinitrilica]MCP1675759.1 C4-dicarboxylate transporter DctM subunit [Natronocella acetinitrilica]